MNARNNTVSISRKRIELRVFTCLRAIFMGPGMIERFDTALEAERANAAGGARFAAFKVKPAELEVVTVDPRDRIRPVWHRRQNRPQPGSVDARADRG